VRPQPHPHKPEERKQSKVEQAQAQRAVHLLEVQDTVKLMDVDWGRRQVYRLLDRAGLIYGDAQVEENLWNPNAMTMSRDVGRRGVCWRMDHIIRRHCPEQWNTMLLEHRQQQTGR